MLVLGRRAGESVLIGDKIKVTVQKSVEGDLRLAIEAPNHIKVMRGELLERDRLSKEKNFYRKLQKIVSEV